MPTKLYHVCLNFHVQSPNDSMSAALSEETTELIAKLTQLQQENWALEEKVDYVHHIFVFFLISWAPIHRKLLWLQMC